MEKLYEEDFEERFDRMPVEMQQRLVAKLARRLLLNRKGDAYGSH